MTNREAEWADKFENALIEVQDLSSMGPLMQNLSGMEYQWFLSLLVRLREDAQRLRAAIKDTALL